MDVRRQLVQAERLGDAVVRPGIQSGDDCLRVLTRQQPSRAPASGFDRFDLRTCVRWSEVQQHGIGLRLIDPGEHPLPGAAQRRSPYA